MVAYSKVKSMHLKSQDLLVLLKLSVWSRGYWRQEDLAQELGMVQSQVHASLRRSEDCGLYDCENRSINRPALFELLVHAIRFLVPGRLGPRAIGIPTAWGHRAAFASLTAGLYDPPVWPLPRRPAHQLAAAKVIEGIAVEPLHEKAPQAAARDPKLYELLAAIDAMRIGRARDMEMAREILRSRLLAV